MKTRGSKGGAAAAALAAIAGLAGSAAGQTVLAPIVVEPPLGWRCIDASLALGPAGEVVAVTTEQQLFTTRARYAISMDGAVSFPHAGVLENHQYSPTVVFGDGKFWLTSTTELFTSLHRVKASVKSAGATSFPPMFTILESLEGPLTGIPRGAFGPDPLESGRQRMYVVHNFGEPGETAGCSGDQMRLMSTVRWEGPGDEDWTGGLRISPPGNTCEYVGNAPAAAVTDGGRLVVLSADRDLGVEAWRNGGLPWVVRSDDAGAMWDPTPILVAAGVIPAIAGPQAGDSIAIDSGAHLPNIAVHRRPNGDDHLFAVFLGRAPAPTTDNLDIYISRSPDGGNSFPVDASNLVHLDDMDLHNQTPGGNGPDQLMPTIAAGPCDGDVHLFWYDFPDANRFIDYIQPYYARIRQYGTPSQTVTVVPLGPAFGTQNSVGSTDHLGRRQQLVVRKSGRDLWVYLAYIARSQDTGRTSLHVQRVKWANDFCAGDMNLSGAIEAEDATLFMTAFGAQDPTADLDGDGVIDAADYAIFQNALASGCGE